MKETDLAAEAQARQAILEFLYHRQSNARTIAYLVSYPRSGNTLVREYFSILQGRPQLSVYEGDVVNASGPALTHSLDHVDIIKSHQMPLPDRPLIYLVRDGRNAALSFLYMSYLFGGHQFSRLSEVYDGLRHLDEAEGFWGDHVARALEEAKRRPSIIVRYEDLSSNPQATLARMADFLGAPLSEEVLGESIRHQTLATSYANNPYNGYIGEPEKNSIYDVLRRHRRQDYWRLIFDARTKQYFHERGGTEALLELGYERSADWWRK